MKISANFPDTVILISVYRPPNRDIQYHYSLFNAIYDIVSAYPKSAIYCAGALNLPDICWSDDSVCGHRYPIKINTSTLSLIADCGLAQVVDFPTRNANLLDILFTNRPSLIDQCVSVPGISDHDEIKDQLLLFNDHYLTTFTASTPVDDLWFIPCHKLQDLMEKYVPSKMVRINTKQPWINHNIVQLRRRKQRNYNIAKISNLASDWAKYKTLKRCMQTATRQAFNGYMHRMINNSYQNGKKKQFYGYIKSLRSDRAGIPPLLKDDQTFTDSQDKANILNHYFCSVFSHDNNDDFPYIGDSPFPNIPPIELHCLGINKVLKSLDPSKAAGPDGLPSRYLKLIANELTPSLFLLFSASLQQGRIPTDWKRAMITPIFKKALCNDPTNYKPISLTSIICKVLERIIYSHIMSNLECNNVLNNAQFGFRQRRSADLQLLQTVHDLALSLNEKSQTDCIFLDFSKAFDKVSHHLLLLKLRYYGINGPLTYQMDHIIPNKPYSTSCL